MIRNCLKRIQIYKPTIWGDFFWGGGIFRGLSVTRGVLNYFFLQEVLRRIRKGFFCGGIFFGGCRTFWAPLYFTYFIKINKYDIGQINRGFLMYDFIEFF